MRTPALLLAIALTSVLAARGDACGYGNVDPDMETACTGDEHSAKEARNRLFLRGKQAIPVAQAYLVRAEQSDADFRTYLEQLHNGERQLDKPTAEREIARAENYLVWNKQRIDRAKFILYRLQGGKFSFLLVPLPRQSPQLLIVGAGGTMVR
ncbi:hypothetical protein [Lignipirellula cremea]|uniref:Uncharacterized protein n=1 Tax=Lignipirellula cremea TaxID=2528010 RepID=A0A518E4H9_9BACT|nr:hypothetical protein [Lignipirellula cremea]QDU98982.1 hypothetical protein Pla8534_68930 [Lignipirellula cremea]